jgi:hypothetical protein
MHRSRRRTGHGWRHRLRADLRAHRPEFSRLARPGAAAAIDARLDPPWRRQQDGADRHPQAANRRSDEPDSVDQPQRSHARQLAWHERSLRRAEQTATRVLRRCHGRRDLQGVRQVLRSRTALNSSANVAGLSHHRETRSRFARERILHARLWTNRRHGVENIGLSSA